MSEKKSKKGKKPKKSSKKEKPEKTVEEVGITAMIAPDDYEVRFLLVYLS